ncbi:membrane protein of unknown function [Bradyrhizobium sp. ORS 285]|uniref:hypothetical protein n=1 Tax=Bradyrhizobium sp. ORS 285 TaxID=115808 RepID=UPI0002408FE2|nr:hypothetical protein [Bradyrhizobium sp. ORS 285]CCD89196.1 membrane hypothetical protein [Bradyrhizobium sp. ORS 285]SMX59453.1 membrane protein of unknown function [Bradyrhizobium sp. ORS 285]
MKYADFSSVVQLGVGLHVGTAVLQLYGELGLQPLNRALARINSLFLAPEHERPAKELEDELLSLEGKYEIFKIRLSKEFEKYILGNSFVAITLAVILVVLAYKADDPISEGWEAISLLFVGLSLLPAPVSLGVFWFDADRQVKPLREEADALERKAQSP